MFAAVLIAATCAPVPTHLMPESRVKVGAWVTYNGDRYRVAEGRTKNGNRYFRMVPEKPEPFAPSGQWAVAETVEGVVAGRRCFFIYVDLDPPVIDPGVNSDG